VKVKITKNKQVKQIFPQIRDIITSLDIGKASQPIPSEIGILVFMVCDRKDLPPNEINREQVANNISRETLARISDREQRNLRRRSFVSTRG
jgi:peptidyl-prolyl cis-trans isomerase SurA